VPGTNRIPGRMPYGPKTKTTLDPLFYRDETWIRKYGGRSDGPRCREGLSIRRPESLAM